LLQNIETKNRIYLKLKGVVLYTFKAWKSKADMSDSRCGEECWMGEWFKEERLCSNTNKLICLEGLRYMSFYKKKNSAVISNFFF